MTLSLINAVNVASESDKQKNLEKKKILVSIFKVADENNRIRIRIR